MVTRSQDTYDCYRKPLLRKNDVVMTRLLWNLFELGIYLFHSFFTEVNTFLCEICKNLHFCLWTPQFCWPTPSILMCFVRHLSAIFLDACMGVNCSLNPPLVLLIPHHSFICGGYLRLFFAKSFFRLNSTIFINLPPSNSPKITILSVQSSQFSMLRWSTRMMVSQNRGTPKSFIFMGFS